MCDFKPNKSSNQAARLDKKAVHMIEEIFLDQEDVHTNLECGGNTPNIDGWIELLDPENRITSKITVQIKHLPTGQCFYSIPQYICGYAERIKSEVIVFIACDPENKCFYWRVIDEEFLELFRNNSKGQHQSWRYYFREEEYCNESKVRSTIDNWHSLYYERISSIKNERQQAASFAKHQRIPFASIKSTFDFLSNSHIRRAQVEELLNWIEEPVSEKHGNLCILQGHAGVGKSVVINDLIEELDKKEIKTLCIKADSLNMMSEEIKLDKLIDYIQYLKADQRILVLIIDQIDALSQYLTNDRDKINLFITLIAKLGIYQDVKIVVSCRKYDLEYDNNLHSLCRNARLIDIGKLSGEEVKRIVGMLKEGLYVQLNSHTTELLRTAYLLNLFCMIYNRKGKTIIFQNAHQLYDEFWRLLIDNAPNTFEKHCVEDTLFKVAEYALGQKTLSPIISLDANGNLAMDYLASNNAIVKNQNCYSFFHQSFYDYTLARLYTQKNGSFIEKIQDNFQGFEMRSSVKAVLEYERAHSPEQYSNDLQLIFLSSKIRKHIKLLALSLIAMSDDVCDCEHGIISQVCSKDINSLSFFLRGICHEKWFISLKPVVLSLICSLSQRSELLYPIANYLSCASFKYPMEVFHIIEMIEDKNVGTYITNNVLRGHNDYRRKFVRDALLRSNLDSHFHINALIDALKTNKKFVFDETENLILDYLLRDKNNKHDAYMLVETLCKKLSDDYPEEYLAMFHRCFMKVIVRKSKPHYLKELTVNEVFGYHMDEYDKKLFYIYKKLLVMFSSDSVRITPIIKELYASNNECALCLAFEIMSLNPLLYEERIHDILSDNSLMDVFLQGDIEFYFLTLLRNWYLVQSPEQKSSYETLILNFKSKSDTISNKNRDYDRKLYPFIEYNKWKLISVTIPEITSNTKIRRCRQELNRRYYNKPYELEKPDHNVHVAEFCGGSLSKEGFARLSFKRWIDLFSVDERWHHGRKPIDIRVNANQFMECVCNDTCRFKPFVFDLFADDSIRQIYKVAGIKGLLEGGVDIESVWSYVKRFLTVDFVTSAPHEFENIVKYYLELENEHIDELVCFLKSVAILPDIDDKTYTSMPGSNELEGRVNTLLTRALNSHQGKCVDLLINLCGLEQRRAYGYQILNEIEPFISEDIRLLVIHKIFHKDYYVQELTQATFEHYIKRLFSEALFLCAHAIQYYWYRNSSFIGEFINRINGDARTHKLLAEIYFYGLTVPEMADEYRRRLEELILENEEEVIADIVRICIKNYTHDEYTSICEQYLRRFSNDERENVIHSYCWHVDELPLDAFDLFIEVYSCFKANKFRDISDELKYIKKCIIEYPRECLEFIQSQDYEGAEISHLVDEEITEALLMIYKRLNENNDLESMNSLMNTFERLIYTGNSFVINRIENSQ